MIKHCTLTERKVQCVRRIPQCGLLPLKNKMYDRTKVVKKMGMANKNGRKKERERPSRVVPLMIYSTHIL